MSEGSRSGVNWMRLKLRIHRARQRLGQRRLARARKILQQDVAAAGKGGQQLARRGGLPLHDPGNIGRDPLVNLARRLVVGPPSYLSSGAAVWDIAASLIAAAPIAAN